MTEIVWEEPPADMRGCFTAGRGKWQLFADALRERPGEWALAHADVTPGRASTIQTQLKRKGLECVTRGAGKVRAVYARWPEA